ncbi:MAG: zinc ribbon domain-containing protein [bacterium]
MADIFEKITGKIDKGIKAVSSKGKELIETTKLKSEIKDVQNFIESRFQALGKKVFEMLNRGALNEDDLREDYGEIASLFKQITELEDSIKKAELEALKMRFGADAIMCSKCGSPNRPGDKFCSSCGSAIVTNVISEGKSCPTCGASLKEDAKFCVKCGGKVGG